MSAMKSIKHLAHGKTISALLCLVLLASCASPPRKVEAVVGSRTALYYAKKWDAIESEHGKPNKKFKLWAGEVLTELNNTQAELKIKEIGQ